MWTLFRYNETLIKTLCFDRKTLSIYLLTSIQWNIRALDMCAIRENRKMPFVLLHRINSHIWFFFGEIYILMEKCDVKMPNEHRYTEIVTDECILVFMEHVLQKLQLPAAIRKRKQLKWLKGNDFLSSFETGIYTLNIAFTNSRSSSHFSLVAVASFTTSMWNSVEKCLNFV